MKREFEVGQEVVVWGRYVDARTTVTRVTDRYVTTALHGLRFDLCRREDRGGYRLKGGGFARTLYTVEAWEERKLKVEVEHFLGTLSRAWGGPEMFALAVAAVRLVQLGDAGTEDQAVAATDALRAGVAKLPPHVARALGVPKPVQDA